MKGSMNEGFLDKYPAFGWEKGISSTRISLGKKKPIVILLGEDFPRMLKVIIFFFGGGFHCWPSANRKQCRFAIQAPEKLR